MKSVFTKKIRTMAAAVLAFSLLLSGCASKDPQAPTAAAGSKFPEKSISVIVPWAAGGGTDLIFRKLTDLMSNDLGKPIVIMNVEGGGGQVGFQQIAAAEADGYTLGAVTNSMLIQKVSQGTKLGAQDFSVVSMINYDPAAITVNVDSPYSTLKEFADAAKADPGKLRIGNSGAKGVWHIAAMLMEKEMGVQVTHVPYEGANPAAVAVAGGHIEGVTVSPGEVKGLVEGGKLKMLGVMNSERLASFPDVPTLKESGYDLQFGVWRALVAPKGVPADVIAKLEASVKKAMESEDFKKFMTDNQFGIYFMNAADAQKYMIEEETTLSGVLAK
jgi:tripartite-type tricarboxylate transporter receptor subunit TctC